MANIIRQCTMHDLTAQVTSSLLPFPGVTINALGEDEITLDSVLQGKFTIGRSGLGWLAYGPHLEAVHAVTGERLSAYTFSGGGEHPPCILAAKDFGWLKRSGLLIGLEETEGSVLCLYDLGLSRVVKAVVIPGRITAIEPIVSYGGASASTQHLHQSLRWFFGIAAVGTDLGHVLLVDLCLDDLSCSQSELEASDLQVVTKSPAEIPKLREVSSREGRHLCLQLNGATGVGATALQYISRTNQLAVGFSDGYLHLWNMKTLKKEYNSQLEGGKVPVNAFTFQEPENDPRNCCYLWAVQSSQDLEGDMVSLRLLQLAFSERKCSASGKILYEGLEYCEERYSQELSGTAFPLRAQATNTRLLSCQTIEKFRPHLDRDDSMNEVASPDTSVSVFSWQVKAYGQGSPATYIGVFDINRWYHAQMPDSLRAGESLQNCPYLAVWSLDAVMQLVSPHVLLDVVVNERSLSRGLPYTCPPPEQYFSPTTYNFDATCLLNTGIIHLTCSGYQKETLGFLKKAAPCSSDVISSSYSRCLMSGLLSSRLTDTQASTLTQEEQLDAILCTAVETSALGLITGCIKQWTAEEQPGSALNLRYILDWAWNKVVQTKEELDGICAPLFDSSSNFTDPQTMQLLQHSQRLLTNLSTIFHCLLSEAQELTQKGLMGLMNKNMVSGLISKYAQVVLWFCRTGLLPEGSDEDALQISRPFYSHSVISNYYTIRREELSRLAKGKWCADCLMIDGLVNQCGDRLAGLWKRDEGGTGQYPPPTIHALLDIYLLDNIDEAAKHAIVIYLLLDVMYAFSNKEGASVESFPTAFAIPIGLVKLIQGLWLLDHHDHQSAFELLLHPAASPCQFEWQHERILQALMCQGQHTEALRYFHVTKPPIASTSQAKLCLSVLLHNRCLIEAWALIRQHSNRLNISELLEFLYETCQELGLIKELLKLPLGLSEQDGLEKFLQGTGGLQNRELLMVHYLQQANYIPALQLNQALKMNMVNERDPKLKEQSNTRNSILDQYGKVLPRVQRKLATERAKPYHHPHAIHKEVSRPQPLSAVTKRSANEKVISRAGFINNVLTKIEEVWIGKEVSPRSSPAKSPKAIDLKNSPSSALPEPFLGTPITMPAKRKSRLMKLVVQPSCPMSQGLLTPPRPTSSWVSPKSISKASELSLLQTPQVVKRARALAASGPVFAAFTPQSILRSSLRPTPVATPSASPGRSITPPLRKENRITFIEEAESPEVEKSIHWTNGEAADDEISLFNREKVPCMPWSSHKEEDVQREEPQSNLECLPPTGGSLSPHMSVSNPPSVHEDTEEPKPHLVSSFETSEMSIRSTDTTLEFYDAPLAEEQYSNNDDEDGVVIIKAASENEGSPQSILTNKQVESEQEQEVPEEQEEHEENDTFKDSMVTHFVQETTNEDDDDVPAEKMEEEILIKVCTEQEESMFPIAQEESTHGCNEVPQGSNSQAEDVCEQSTVLNDPLCMTETAEETEDVKPSEDTEPTDEALQEPEQSADLTEFVQRHLFGDDLSSPLTRSGIHSLPRTSVSESVKQDEEEVENEASTAPAFSSQKSTTSVTSSEPTGTDSHSIVSVNDSEELSRPVSGDDEDELEEESEEEEEVEEEEEEIDDNEEEEEEEDSGSEVEIIEEIQGRPPLIESSEFEEQEKNIFLPNFTEKETEIFSNEIKPAEDAAEELVMVQAGTDGEIDEEEDQEESYVDLKPSTTLLVPLELVEGHSVVNSSELESDEIFQTAVPNDLKTESQSSFSLTLDLEDDGEKEPELNENKLLSCDITQFELKESNEQPLPIPEDEDVVNVCIDLPDTKVLVESGENELECLEADTPVELNEEEPNAEKISENILENHMKEDATQETEVINDEQTEHEETEIQVKEQSLHVPDLEPVDALSVTSNKTDIQDVTVRDEVVEEEKTESSDRPIEPEESFEEDALTPSTESIQVTHEEPQTGDPFDASKEQDEVMETRQETKDGIEEDNETQQKNDNSHKEELEVALNEHIDIVVDHQPILVTPGSGRKSRATITPTRRTTRASRTVTFMSPVPEEMHQPKEEKNEPEAKTEDEQETITAVATSPSRSVRRNKQVKEKIASTPRRSTRRTKPEPDPKSEQEEEMDVTEIVHDDNTVSSTTLSPGRRRASQRTTRSSKQSSSEEADVDTESEIVQEAADINIVAKSSGRGKTPTKRKAAQSTTPRRSSRRTGNISEEAPQPLEIVEEGVEEQVSATPPKSITKRSKAEPTLPTPEEEENNQKQLTLSPARGTRQANRNTLGVYPQVKLVPISLPQSMKKRGKKDQRQSEPQPQDDAEAPHKNKNEWDQPEEELPLLDPPLEVDSETPVADALMKRLQDDIKQDVSKPRTRTSKRNTKSVVDPEPSVESSLTFDPDKSSPGESSFIYSPSRRKNTAKSAESQHHSERAAPVTRSRRKESTATAVAPLQDDVAAEVKVEHGLSNTRKSSKKATKSKSLLEPTLIAEVDLLSPLPSPVDSAPRAQKRTKEAEGPTSTMNLRRKRIMDTVLSKPVTRRKRL